MAAVQETLPAGRQVGGVFVRQAIYARLGYVEIERRSEDGYRRIYMEKPLTD